VSAASIHGAPRLLVIGPLPRKDSPIGGTQVSFAERVERLRAGRAFELEVIDTSRAPRGPRAWRDLRALGSVLLAVLIGRRADAILLCASTGALLRAGGWIALAARLRRTPLAVSAFGGCLDLGWERASGLRRKWLALTLMRAPLFLVQTRALADRFRRFPGIEWPVSFGGTCRLRRVAEPRTWSSLNSSVSCAEDAGRSASDPNGMRSNRSM
jgi:hypothetical protein